MGIFGGARNKLRRGEKSATLKDAGAVVRESKELRRQVAHDLLNPARATATQIRMHMTHVDRQLVELEKLRWTVQENHTQFTAAKAETDRLREQRRGLRQMQKAGKKQKALSKPRRRKILGLF